MAGRRKLTKLSKGEIRKRLQLSGHWKEAIKFREHLKAETMVPEVAWARMEAHFMPLYESWALKNMDLVVAAAQAEEAPEPGAPPTAARHRRAFRAGRPNLREDCDWIYLHLDTPENQLPAPPSAGALAALFHYRTHRKEFYELYFARLLPSRASVDGEGVKADNHKTTLELLESIERNSGQPDQPVLPEGSEEPAGELAIS